MGERRQARKKAHVAEEEWFRPKAQIALAQIEVAVKAGVGPGIVLADAGYGSGEAFRAGVMAPGLIYAAGIQSTLLVGPPGEEPLPPKILERPRAQAFVITDTRPSDPSLPKI
ncbi:MAG: transposase [Hyphomicrobiales bacterium]|nr:transposase [Hyphomicrobiales bacterium]